jgi:hypothetical protein
MVVPSPGLGKDLPIFETAWRLGQFQVDTTCKDGLVSEDGSHDRWLTAALAEFQALRGEIVQRIQLQQVLLGLAIRRLERF